MCSRGARPPGRALPREEKMWGCPQAARNPADQGWSCVQLLSDYEILF